MADERLLPAGIADDRSRAFLELVGRLQEIDRTPLLVYRIDSVPAGALYALAWQFGVTGLAGWDLATTEVQRRDLVRRAVVLHRRKGTPWAIKQALSAVGFPATIEGHYGRSRRDGTLLRDGQSYHSAGGAWPNFAVICGEPDDGQPITPARRALLKGIVETWKNARSRLVILLFTSYRHDGRYLRDGTMVRAGV